MKYQKLFKTLIIGIFQDMYCCAHKTATLTSIQHTVRGGGQKLPILLSKKTTKREGGGQKSPILRRHGHGRPPRIFFSSPSYRVQTRWLPFWRHMHIKCILQPFGLANLRYFFIKVRRSKERHYRFIFISFEK